MDLEIRSPMNTESASILLVDDVLPFHDVFGLFLREAGYFVGCAENGLAGLRMFKEGVWDLVITDLAMPEMGGEELAEEIRKISADVPLILITGSQRSDARVGLFDEILEKPFSRNDLLTATAKALQKASLRRIG